MSSGLGMDILCTDIQHIHLLIHSVCVAIITVQRAHL